MQKSHMKQNINIWLRNAKIVGWKHYNDFKAFIEYSDYMLKVYKNIERYNPGKKCKVLIVFEDLIADMISDKKLSSIVTELIMT